MEYYSAIIKSEIMPFVTTWSDLESIMLTYTNQTEPDKYHDFTYTRNLKQTKQNRNRVIVTSNKQVVVARE